MKSVVVGENHLVIQVPQSKAFAYETSTNLPKLHQNMLIVGARGQGKTVAAVNVLRMLQFDRIFVISHTMKSNAEIMKTLKIDPKDVYEDPDDITCIQKIKDAVQKEAEDLEKFREDMRKYERMMKTRPTFCVSPI